MTIAAGLVPADVPPLVGTVRLKQAIRPGRVPRAWISR